MAEWTIQGKGLGGCRKIRTTEELLNFLRTLDPSSIEGYA